MSVITCGMVRAAALDPSERPRDWTTRPGVADHLHGCSDCRDWLDAFGAGERAWANEPAGTLADAVIARTTGVETLLRDLPSLATMDPGLGFAERVLLATSKMQAPQSWRVRLAASWWSLVRRPRFAWEAAYVATVCWVLLFGNPVGALERSAASLRTVAHERFGVQVKDLRTDLESWRAKWAPETARPAGAAPRGAEAVHPIVRAWQAGSKQVERLTVSVMAVLEDVWGRISDWVGWLVDQLRPPRTEPDARPVRSAQ
jgi:hypothetical protein